FQETDIVAMAAPVTKAAIRVRSAKDLPDLLEESFRIAISGRPGPVLLDVPMDLQRYEVPAPRERRIEPAPARLPSRSDVAGLLKALSQAQRPLVLIGG